MSTQPSITRKTAPEVTAHKGGTPLVCLTAYDAPTAAWLDDHCDVILVGDSVGMVVHGLPTTVGVSLDMMILHGKAVMRGSHKALIVVDMPFGSYEDSVENAFRNASKMLIETGCQAVKIESGAYAAETISYLVERGIPVMSHVGLRPQSMHVLGGFRVRGQRKAVADEIIANAVAADQAGSFAMVVEGVSEALANEVTRKVSIPTIGIGASNGCDGQILVTPDMLGYFETTPKFVKKYAAMESVVTKAVKEYAKDVRTRKFPSEQYTYMFKNKL